jgi:hypothetical protein
MLLDNPHAMFFVGTTLGLVSGVFLHKDVRNTHSRCEVLKEVHLRNIRDLMEKNRRIHRLEKLVGKYHRKAAVLHASYKALQEDHEELIQKGVDYLVEFHKQQQGIAKVAQEDIVPIDFPYELTDTILDMTEDD